MIKIIDMSEKYLSALLGSKWSSEEARGLIESLLLDYACFRVCLLLLGGVPIAYFDYSISSMEKRRAGAAVDAIMGALEQYRSSCIHKWRMLLPIALEGKSPFEVDVPAPFSGV